MADSHISVAPSYESQPKSSVEKGNYDEVDDKRRDISTVINAVHITSVESDNPNFVLDLRYSKEEEAKVVRIFDTRLFPVNLLTTFVLNMDRTNNSNAISDNLPADLGFNIDVVNTATAIYSVLFSIFTLTGAVIAKIAGPARCKLFSHLSTAIDANGLSG